MIDSQEVQKKVLALPGGQHHKEPCPALSEEQDIKSRIQDIEQEIRHLNTSRIQMGEYVFTTSDWSRMTGACLLANAQAVFDVYPSSRLIMQALRDHVKKPAYALKQPKEQLFDTLAYYIAYERMKQVEARVFTREALLRHQSAVQQNRQKRIIKASCSGLEKMIQFNAARSRTV